MNAVCEPTVVIASVVPEDDRLEFLPKHLSFAAMLRFEPTLYGWMSTLCKAYSAGGWGMVSLSNGGFFMYPKAEPGKRFELVVDGNGFKGSLSEEAVGVVVTLFALNELLLIRGGDQLAKKHNALREYIFAHPEKAAILRAID